MMRLAIVPATTVAVLLAAAGQAAAQAPACQGRECIEQKWKALHDHAVDQLRSSLEPARQKAEPPPVLAAAVQERDRATRQASIIAAVDAVEPDDSTAAATVRRLAGAIKTNPEGTEAGLVIAPFALAGEDCLAGLEVTFAALKDDFTRTGVSYTKDASPKLRDVWKRPAACPIEPRIKKLEGPRDFYLTACTAVVAELPETLGVIGGLTDAERTSYQKTVRGARLACGLADPGGSTVGSTLAEAIALVGRAVETTNRVAARTEGVIPAQVVPIALSLTPKVTELANWTLASATSCYSDSDIQGYFRQLYWRVRTWKFAVGASFDLFPRKWGFDPAASEPPQESDADLPNGDVKLGEARIDFSTAKAGTEFSFGSGFGRGRDKLEDDLRGYVPLSFSFAHAFSLLPKKQPLRTTDGELNVVEGEMPPRLVFGVISAVQLAVNKRESQETRFNTVKIQPHLDFLINDTLSFRLGIPFKGEIVVREKKDAVAETPTTPAKPAVTEKRDLQWTVPVAIVAVLKL